MIARLTYAMLAATAMAGCTPSATNTVENTTTIVADDPGSSAAMNGAMDNGMAPNAMTPAGGAVAMLTTADGTAVGQATATETGGAITVTIQATGMPAGVHGFHVHTTGKCEAPKFESAGGHWNPDAKKHGTQNPAGPHAGDMPNLTIAADGTGTASATLPSGTMAGLLDADGSAVLVHAGPDDYKTDPSGDSGDRIACGVFKAS